MFKYGRMQKKIPPRLVCGSHGACLDSMLPGVQVTVRLGFFLYSSHLSDGEDSHSLLSSSQVPSGIVYHEICISMIADNA